jgi:hypothetical protein
VTIRFGTLNTSKVPIAYVTFHLNLRTREEHLENLVRKYPEQPMPLVDADVTKRGAKYEKQSMAEKETIFRIQGWCSDLFLCDYCPFSLRKRKLVRC